MVHFDFIPDERGKDVNLGQVMHRARDVAAIRVLSDADGCDLTSLT